MNPEHVDVLIVGAGLSGLGAECHLKRTCPGRSFMLLEGREATGGTWDLFRYPGIRSDSDMHTLGYSFRPWRDDKAIADGPAILAYIRDTAREHGIDPHIRLGHQVERARWSSETCRWTIEAERTNDGDSVTLTCSFLLICAGYYSYEGGHRPRFEGEERFRGPIVHPQDWPEDLVTAGQRVVVIGSGATAMTLVPALAKTAAHVTMLQRSPTYVLVGPRTELTHQTWQGDRIAADDLVYVEEGGCARHYAAPLMRTAVVGKASDRVQEIADASRRSLDAVIAAMRPGRKIEEVDAINRALIAEAGLSDYYRHRTGYGVGIDFLIWIERNGMSFNRGNTTPFAPGMTFHLPIVFFVPGVGGIGFSETVLVTEDGCEAITDFPRELEIG